MAVVVAGTMHMNVGTGHMVFGRHSRMGVGNQKKTLRRQQQRDQDEGEDPFHITIVLRMVGLRWQRLWRPLQKGNIWLRKTRCQELHLKVMEHPDPSQRSYTW